MKRVHGHCCIKTGFLFSNRSLCKISQLAYLPQFCASEVDCVVE